MHSHATFYSFLGPNPVRGGKMSVTCNSLYFYLFPFTEHGFSGRPVSEGPDS